MATILDDTVPVFSRAKRTRAGFLGNVLKLPCRSTAIIIHLSYCHSGIILPFWKSSHISTDEISFGNVWFHIFGITVNFASCPQVTHLSFLLFLCVRLVGFQFSSGVLWKESLADYSNSLIGMEKRKNAKIYSIDISTHWKLWKS